MATAFSDQDDFYKMDASPKGICLIINNFEFELSDHLDAGPANRENLNRIFQELDFEVRYFENLTCEQIKTQMANIKKTNHSNYNCFVCCICSHGGTKGVCGSDDYTVTIAELQSFIYSRECPSLSGKPKVFFVDTCRGGEGHRGLYQPLAPAQGRRVVITDKRDFLLSFATTPDNVAWSNSKKGSVFFYHLTMLLKHHAKSKSVVRILHMLNEALTNERPEQHLQTAEYTSTLAKELRFHHPVQAMVTASRPAFRFHANHGKRVVLSNNQQTAAFQAGRLNTDGIVMSRDPMKVNKLYEVQITKRGGDDGWTIGVGVVTSSPDSLTLPCRPQGWESAVHVNSHWLEDHGVETYTDIGKALGNFRVDMEKDIDILLVDSLGVSVDPSRRLHLHVDGVDQGVVPCRPLPDPCWALWVLDQLYKEVRITKRGKEVWSLLVGVVTSSPDSLTLPRRAGGWESAVAVYSDCFTDHGPCTDTDIGKALKDFPVDSRVGVSVDPSRRLHLHVNGADQGVVPCRPLPDPCWALWEFSWIYREGKTLPVTPVA